MRVGTRAGSAIWVLVCGSAIYGQTSPNVSQVLAYSATMRGPSGAAVLPSIFTETQVPTDLLPVVTSLITPLQKGVATACAPTTACGQALTNITTPGNYSVNQSFFTFIQSLNTSIATALSIVPLSSPASGVIQRVDPATAVPLPASGTLGPIFTERAETIGKGKFYLGFSNQDLHFTNYNGSSLNAIHLLYPGGQSSALNVSGAALQTEPATISIGMDVKLTQNIAFLTYGLTDKVDISVGLPMVHAAVAARTWNGMIYAGNGYATPTCWCVDTFTPGSPTMELPQIGQASASKTGFGDLLLRGKAAVFNSPHMVVAVGADLRLPTGDAKNYLGVGATSLKPFTAVSFFSKTLGNGIVFSPHLDAGWQFTGKSILGGNLAGSPLTGQGIGAPFAYAKDYIPDVFSWAAGAEVALGRRSTVVADVLGNEIGWIHGIENTSLVKMSNVSFPTSPNGSPLETPTTGDISGFVPLAKKVSYAQYSGSFGYKARIAGNLVAYFDALVRFDNNGLTSRFAPMFGLGYSF